MISASTGAAERAYEAALVATCWPMLSLRRHTFRRGRELLAPLRPLRSERHLVRVHRHCTRPRTLNRHPRRTRARQHPNPVPPDHLHPRCGGQTIRTADPAIPDLLALARSVRHHARNPACPPLPADPQAHRTQITRPHTTRGRSPQYPSICPVSVDARKLMRRILAQRPKREIGVLA